MPEYMRKCAEILQSNPKIANTPQGQEFMRILQTGDVEAGKAMADNLCRNLGTTQQGFVQSLVQKIFGRR